MIKFYLKLQNKMLTKNLLYIVAFLVLIFNVILRIFPEVFINIPNASYNLYDSILVPIELFTYCDGYLLMLFIILIFFFLGVDYSNSMEEIALVVGGSKTNKFMARKLVTLLMAYIVVYTITFVNIYTIYIKFSGNTKFLPIKEIIFYSFTTNLFVITLSLFLLFFFRDIVISTSIITAIYLIEELLWRCKVMDTNGILGHIYGYFDYEHGEIYKVKFIYIILSLVLLFATYMLSKRKASFDFIKKFNVKSVFIHK